MTVNDFLAAIAAKLDFMFPDRLVFVDQIESCSDGNHFVRCVNQRHDKGLDRQRKRSYTFEIDYFQKVRDNMAFNNWAEIMCWAFESLTVGDQLFHLHNLKAEPGDDMVFHFTFDVDTVGLIDPVVAEPMETLENDVRVKER